MRTIEYKLNGELHREDGPAVERSDGYKSWFLNGKRHREDGPAVERSNGNKEWYLNGEELSEREFNTRVLKNTPLNVVIDGVTYIPGA